MKLRRSAGVAAAAAVALLVTACAGSGGDAESGDGQGATLSYVGFGGVMDEGVYEAWMEPFGESVGVDFALDSPTDYSEIQIQVETGNVSYDLIDGDQFFINPQCGVLFEQLDVDTSNNLPEFQPGSDCSVPHYVYGIGMYYNLDDFPNGGPQTCEDFFDTDQFPGQRMIWTYAAAAGVLECAAIASGADPLNPYPIDIDQALEKIETIKDHISTYDSGAQVNDAMINGDAAIAMATTIRYVDAVEQGANFEVAEGFIGRSTGAFAVPLGAPNRDRAQEFLNYIAEPEVAQRLADAAPPYSSVTGGEIPEDWPEAAKQVEVVSGPLADVAWDVDQDWWADNYGEVSDRYVDLLIG